MSYQANDQMPPIHPGEHLREDYLVPLNMSAVELALALHVPEVQITHIIQEKQSINAGIALRLAKYFKTGPDYWMRWQSDYDLRIAAEKEAASLAEIVPCVITD